MEHQQFPYYIEDWILWAGNIVDDQGTVVDHPYYQTFYPRIKLANYDIGFINYSCENILQGIGFTDKQLKTAAKIITKYRRQISQKLDITPDYLLDSELPPHRIPCRAVDRRFAISRDNNRYIVQFPYDPKMVSTMHEYREKSSGGFDWNRDARVWSIAALENNLAFLCDFVTQFNNHDWSIDASVVEDFAVVKKAQYNIFDYVPYLELANEDQVRVYNSNVYLDQALAELDLTQNLTQTVFFADNYGLRIGPKLTEYIKEQYSDIHQVLLTSQSRIFENGSKLHTDLSISNIEYFMKTVQAEHWVVVTFGIESTENNQLVEAVFDADVPGTRSCYHYQIGKKYTQHEFLLDKLEFESVVLFVDNTYVLNQLLSELAKSNMLSKVIYLYSHDTGK